MKINKKTILISWFIGLGSGLFISGIILSILLYASNKNTPILENKEEESQTVRQEQQSDKADTVQSTQTSITVKGHSDQEIQDSPEEGNTKDIGTQTIEINIEPAATAREITAILVSHGVIPDYDEFIAYIVSKNAERSLSHGNLVFPLNSDVETVFKILRP